MSTPTRFEPEQLRNQHIAAIRRVRLATEASGEPTTGPEAIEIETKHGRIVHLSAAADTLELRSGAFRGTVTSAVATPPQRRRTQQDLTAELAAAFDGRPVIEAATRDGAGWRITLSTGASLVCSAGPQGLVIWCTAAPKPRPDSPAPAQRKHSLPEIERRGRTALRYASGQPHDEEPMSTPARELLTIWIQAVNDGDVALLTGLYDSSARLLPTFSPHFLSKPEQIHNYFEQLASREDLSVQLHEGSVVDQQLSESVSGASGLYSFSFRVDGVLLSFASRFSFLVDTTKPAPIIHHHSSQVPRTLN